MRLSTRVRIVLTSAVTMVSALVRMSSTRRESNPRRVLVPGDRAPDFDLEASDGRRYRLSDFRQRQVVVLAWFPKAFTGGCAMQCESIGAYAARLRDRGAAVFGANVDTPETNRQFAAALDLDFPILSDPTHATAIAYGVEGASGLPARWTFVVGLDGRILSVDTAVRVRTSGADIDDRLQQLRLR